MDTALGLPRFRLRLFAFFLIFFSLLSCYGSLVRVDDPTSLAIARSIMLVVGQHDSTEISRRYSIGSGGFDRLVFCRLPFCCTNIIGFGVREEMSSFVTVGWLNRFSMCIFFL
jgi:hypothetical protein